METNLEKAKRLLRDSGAVHGNIIPENGFLMKLLELAATPDKPNLVTLHTSDYNDPNFTVG